MVRCPCCGYEGDFETIKVHWNFRFYTVRTLKCPKCGGIFNHYNGVSPRGKRSEFEIRLKPRVSRNE